MRKACSFGMLMERLAARSCFRSTALISSRAVRSVGWVGIKSGQRGRRGRRFPADDDWPDERGEGIDRETNGFLDALGGVRCADRIIEFVGAEMPMKITVHPEAGERAIFQTDVG